MSSDALRFRICVPAIRAEFEIQDACLLRVLQRANTARSSDQVLEDLRFAGLDPDQACKVFWKLVEGNILVTPERAEIGIMWRRYNWDEARFLSLACQDETFLDEEDPGNERRITTLQAYASTDDPYSEAPPTGSIHIPLSQRPIAEAPPIWELLQTRRTTRVFQGTGAHFSALEQMLGNPLSTFRLAHGQSRDDVAGLLQSRFAALEVHIVAHRIATLRPGAYRYNPRDHTLSASTYWTDSQEVDDAIVRINWGQTMPRNVAFSVFLVADFRRQMWQYRYPRAYRNLLLAIGELAQILLVAGQLLGLKSFMTPAIRDSVADGALSLSDDKHAMYLLGFGN